MYGVPLRNLKLNYMNIFKRKLIFNDITSEIHRAEGKHPVWPTDIIHGVSIVSEEMGEATREANLLRENGVGDIADLRKELIETCATAMRMIDHIDSGKIINY